MKEITQENIVEYSPLSLASVGDGVHTLFVRETLLKKTNILSNKLHLQASKLCCAKKQSEVYDKIFNLLSENEQNVALRARNHKSHAVKSSSQQEYKKATAFEAVVGYLYLTGQTERLNWVLNKSMEEQEW